MVNVPGYRIGRFLFKDRGFAFYEGIAEADGTTVLLKIPVERNPDLLQLQQLDHEYALTPFLHPSWALQPMDLVRLSGSAALILQFFVGGPLDSENFPLTLAAFFEQALPLTEAVNQTHAAGLVHKDLKPANIFFDSSGGGVRLTGFGIAARQTAHAPLSVQSGMLEGTLSYMAPEQTGQMNRGLDPRSDLYSVGALFYHMLTGEFPCMGSDPLDWVHCILARPPIPPKQREPKIPEMLSSIILRLLEKLPEKRYQTASGLQADLTQCKSEWERSGQISSFPLGREDVSERLIIPPHLYDRKGEIDTLLESYRQVSSTGTPRLSLVSGPPGIGKTALVEEVRQTSGEDQSRFLEGKFEQYTRNIPYATIAQAFRAMVQQILMESEEQVVQWGEKIRHALGANGQLLIEMIPEIEAIIGPQPSVPDLPLSEAEARFRLVFRRFLGLFSDREHPLVLFLDDLQWADHATLRLLSDLLTHRDTEFLLVIGSFRDNEVSPSHPMMLAVEEVRRAGVKIDPIELRQIPLADVTQLIADALHDEACRVRPLAETVYEKTGGNPFFLIQFLMTLNEEQHLTYNRTQKKWSWDLQRIQTAHYTDNVVDFLVNKIKRLPDFSVRLLQVAACAGAAVEPSLLSAAAETEAVEVEKHLLAPLQEGMIIRHENAYLFVHDRVQQAAYAMLAEEERPKVHLAIARELMQRGTAAVAERLFEIAGHFNNARNLLESGEILIVAELNLRAGQRAKAAAAYRPAIDYLDAGRKVLGESCWESYPELCHALAFEQAQCAWLAGDLETAEENLNEVLANADTVQKKTEALQVKGELAMTGGDQAGAIKAILSAFALFGVEWSPHPSAEEVEREYEAVWTNLAGRPIEALIDLPEMTDPSLRTAMAILASLYTPAYWTDVNLLLLVCCRMVNLSLEHGNSDASVVGYAGLGRSIAPHYGRYHEGYQFGKLAYDLVERRKLAGYKARISDLFGLSTSFWVTHARSALDYAREAFSAANEIGDVTFACYACMHIVNFRLICGDPLEEVLRESDVRLDFVLGSGYDEVADILRSSRRLLWKLRGEQREGVETDNEEFEAEFTQRLKKERSVFTVSWHATMQLKGHYWSGAYDDAIGALEEAEPLMTRFMTQVNYPEFVYYAALSLAAHYPQVPEDRQTVYLEKLTSYVDLLRVWAEAGKENFRHRHFLVSAEAARLEGRPEDALSGYENAIVSAREHGFVQDEGMAHELFGNFHLVRKESDQAIEHLRAARYCYGRWGALRKVRKLEQDFLHVFVPESSPLSATLAVSTEQLDMLAVVKASQAISQEMVLPKLTEALLRIVMEHAAASRSAVLISENGQMRPLAEANIQEGHIVVTEPGDGSCDVPESILRYVQRTHKNLLLTDAQKPSSFIRDPYFTRRQPRSVACLPILRQGRLVAVLYLENNLAPGVVDKKRLTFLELLAAQTAISLENASLYSEVLQARNAAEAANRAKDTFLVNMSHELRTPLAVVIGNIELALGTEGLPEEVTEYLTSAGEAGESLLQLIQQILELRNLQEKKIALLEKPVTITECSRGIIDIFRRQAERKGVEFRVLYEEGLPSRVLGDCERVRQVLFHLVGNAVKFTEKGEIEISIRREAKTLVDGKWRIQFQIRDTGMGMPSEMIERLFQPFAQADTSLTRRFGGAGVGLSISKGLVEQMGGEIRVESEEGKGSLFTFVLPFRVVGEANRTPEPSPTREDPQARESNVRILLVEDESMVSEMIRMGLVRRGWEVVTAAHGSEALESLGQGEFDLILMDLKMPVMDGLEATKRIRQGERKPEIPIIALTAHERPEVRKECKEAGMDDFLTKPVRAHQLYQAIEKHLGLSDMSSATGTK